MRTELRLRVLLADDEALARMRLARLLRDQPDVELIAQCANGADVLAALELESHAARVVDVLFLDIAMPGLDGLTLASMPLTPRPQIIFVTAFAEFAARAFDLEAMDYMLKPITAIRLAQALTKVRRARGQQNVENSDNSDNSSNLTLATPELRPSPAYADRMALPIGRRMQLVETDQIDIVCAQANYVEIRANRRSFLVRRTLEKFIVALDPQKFIRVHRCCIVRIDAIAEAQSLASGRFMLRLKDDTKLYAARRYREIIQARLGL